MATRKTCNSLETNKTKRGLLKCRNAHTSGVMATKRCAVTGEANTTTSDAVSGAKTQPAKKTSKNQQKHCKLSKLCYNVSEMEQETIKRLTLEGQTLDEQHRAALRNESSLGHAPEPERTYSDRLQEAQDMKTYD